MTTKQLQQELEDRDIQKERVIENLSGGDVEPCPRQPAPHASPTQLREIAEKTVDDLDKSRCLSTNLDFTKAGNIILRSLEEATEPLHEECQRYVRQLAEVERRRQREVGSVGETRNHPD